MFSLKTDISQTRAAPERDTRETRDNARRDVVSQKSYSCTSVSQPCSRRTRTGAARLARRAFTTKPVGNILPLRYVINRAGKCLVNGYTSAARCSSVRVVVVVAGRLGSRRVAKLPLTGAPAQLTYARTGSNYNPAHAPFTKQQKGRYTVVTKYVVPAQQSAAVKQVVAGITATKCAKPSVANRPTTVAQLAALVKGMPNQGASYSSAAQLFAAAHPFTTKGLGQQARQQCRNNGNYASGGRHSGITPALWLGQYALSLGLPNRAAAAAAARAARAGAVKPAQGKAGKATKAPRKARKAKVAS